jgi:N-methylhydantoinase A
VKPAITTYVASIAGRLQEFAGRATPVPFYVMKSNGGVLSASEVVHNPITTVLSGPAAGALGAALVARGAGVEQVLTCDGGGTSTDVTVVTGGRAALTTEGSVGAYPTKIPMIDGVTPEGTLTVGPHSAGADPGPVCYARGGTAPTVTDAHLVLGRIPPHLLGGEIALDVGAARAAIEELSTRLALGVEQCAEGILEISAWNQANALRQVSVQRGLDVREFTLVTFGGSGSLLACRLADLLGLRGVLVPQDPGNLSAYGLLTVDVRSDHVRTHVVRADRLDVDDLRAAYDDLAGEAREALSREGFGPREQQLIRTADLRYDGQAFEVRVGVDDGPIDAGRARAAEQTFHAEHRRLYGYDFAGDERQPVEWVNLRVTGVGPIRTPERPPAPRGVGAEVARTGERAAYISGTWLDAATYDRARLGAGDVIDGPAVLEEFGSTVPVHPGYRCTVDDWGNLRIALANPPRPQLISTGERR